MHIIFFDDPKSKHLYPLTLTKPASELRCGILTIGEKWKRYMTADSVGYMTDDYLKKKYKPKAEADNYLINGRLLPSPELAEEIRQLETGMAMHDGNTLLATRLPRIDLADTTGDTAQKSGTLKAKSNFKMINRTHDLFTYNGQEIEADFKLLTKGRSSQKISVTNRFRQSDRIFLEKGAKVEFLTLNPADGYIYIAKDAEIMENVSVHGSLSMNAHSVLKMGAKIYGPTSLGPYCKIGGEVNNSIFSAYSNKAHDGFMGNAVIGEWCNIGADTNNSNLKNNYEQVKLWNYVKGSFERTGLQFCGLIMGDHSKCGINTMFNTGTVAGVSANIFGSGFPRNFIPSFSWGGAHGFTEYKLNKALKTAEIMMGRRSIALDTVETEILTKVFEMTQTYRNY